TWQCATIQLDFSMPEKFDLNYIDRDDKQKRPVMLHRVIYGSMERFFGILIEHYGGAFPSWLAPVQVSLIAIADRHKEYADKVIKQMREAGLRVELDDRAETVSAKVRDAQMQKIPFILVAGDKEEKEGTVAVRERSGKVIGPVKVEKFIEQLQQEIREKK
ncbi:MAG: His/Gly/Thr/Pro-type tRNA ligase C-terminal domain-containing protein, partial [Candidatus Diapherotrites archaeon]|nr:His/Gly/Thr/Pro-type tRNA ligase C-terminal domain-containing protein [Candidatus Diapherotrites archaeon]